MRKRYGTIQKIPAYDPAVASCRTLSTLSRGFISVEASDRSLNSSARGGRLTGLRTNTLVALGKLSRICSALFGGNEPDTLAAEVVSGIVFLVALPNIAASN